MDTKRAAGSAKRMGDEARAAAGRITDDSREATRDYYDQAADAAQEGYARARDAARDAGEMGQRYYQEGTRAIGRQVEEHPLPALLLAAVIGFCIGWLSRSGR